MENRYSLKYWTPVLRYSIANIIMSKDTSHKSEKDMQTHKEKILQALKPFLFIGYFITYKL